MTCGRLEVGILAQEFVALHTACTAAMNSSLQPRLDDEAEDFPLVHGRHHGVEAQDGGDENWLA